MPKTLRNASDSDDEPTRQRRRTTNEDQSPPRESVRGRTRGVKMASKAGALTDPTFGGPSVSMFPGNLQNLVREHLLEENVDVDPCRIIAGANIRSVHELSVQELYQSMKDHGAGFGGTPILVTRHEDEAGETFYKCIEGMHRASAAKRLKEEGHPDFQTLKVWILDGLTSQEELIIATKCNEVNTKSVKVLYIQTLEKWRQYWQRCSADLNKDLDKVDYADIRKWLDKAKKADSTPQAQRPKRGQKGAAGSTQDRCAFMIMKSLTEEAWEFLREDAEAAEPYAGQDRLYSKVSKMKTKWGQLIYLTVLWDSLRKTGGRMTDKQAVYNKCTELGQGWESQISRLELVWPEKGLESEGLPPWPQDMADEIRRKTRKPDERLQNAILQAGVVEVKNRNLSSLLIDLQTLAERWWRTQTIGVSWAVALTNVTAGRKFSHEVQTPPPDNPVVRAHSKAARRRKSAEAVEEEASDALEEAEGVMTPESVPPAEPGEAAPPRRQLTKVSEYVELLRADPERVRRYASFYNAKWEDFCRTDVVRPRTVDLAIVDGPWQVMDINEFERDHNWGDSNYAPLAHHLYEFVKDNGTVLIYHGIRQTNKWIDAMENEGFRLETDLVVTMHPRCVNRRNIQKRRPVNASHKMLVFVRVGATTTVRNFKTGPFYLEGDMPCRASVIQNYVPPRRKVPGKDGKPVRREEKSLDMYKELIARYSDAGALIFEPFAGTAAGARAAVITGRQWVGCEVDPVCYEAANDALLLFIARQTVHGQLRAEGVEKRVWITAAEEEQVLTAFKTTGPVENMPLEYDKKLSIAEILDVECMKLGVELRKSTLAGLPVGSDQGCFAKKPFKKNELIGHYWGTVYNPDAYEAHPSDRGARTCGMYEVRRKLLMIVDGSRACAMTYLNDPRGASEPNCTLADISEDDDERRQLFVDQVKSFATGQDSLESILRLPYLMSISAKRDIEAGEELLLGYGEDYWAGYSEEESE